jgi:cyclic pyranopterin monophosphate synthase
MKKNKTVSLRGLPKVASGPVARGLKSARDTNNEVAYGTPKGVPRQSIDQTRLAREAPKLSHYDAAGRASMVDVSGKSPTLREAEAYGFVAMSRKVLRALPRNPKGDPLEVARIAGTQAAKRTSELIPMCHPVPLSKVDVACLLTKDGVEIRTMARTTAVTGVEMEALVAACVAALTVYDMCKALDKGIEIREIRLERKSGGKSGDYVRGVPRRNRS